MDDVSDSFWFFLGLETVASGELQRLKQFAGLLGDALGGVVVTKGVLSQVLEIAGELSGRYFYPVATAGLPVALDAVASGCLVRFYSAGAAG
ncbi:hypothetical protein [Candidatus Vondammii sp. HM_W22]|uniref:hypothetical protein n=1 Tax=Candidatus Vondammii sp. HM_W22 TaxID=2687299 RepID=UPI001F137920|nr:hypothetical protein [Candidatus Vondammii sp. HM_W22]